MNTRALVLGGVLALVLSSCFPTESPRRRRPPEGEPQAVPNRSAAPPDFEDATKNIFVLDQSNPQLAFGNVPVARDMAARFNVLITTMQSISFKGGDDDAFSLTEGKFSTHCELRENQVAFLVHVPQMKNYRDEVRKALLEIAWACAKDVTEETCPDCRLGVGLRGELFYGAIATGDRNGTPSMQMDAVVPTDSLHRFFVGRVGDVAALAPAVAPVSPELASLLNRLNGLEQDERLALRETLAEIDALDEDVALAVPRLLALASNAPDAQVRASALHLLAEAQGEAMVPTLEAALRDVPWNLVMVTAADELLRLGAPGRAALERQYRQSPHTHTVIITRIEAADVDHRLFLPLLRESAGDANHRVRTSSFNLLAAMHDVESIPAMIGALEGGSVQSREAAARALTVFGPDAKDAVPALAALFAKETSRPVLLEVASALQAIGPDASEAIPVLRDRAESTEWLRDLVDETVAAIEGVEP